MKKYRYVTVHYRRLLREDGDFPPTSLANLINDALNFKHESKKRVREDWNLRTEKSTEDQVRFINNVHLNSDYVFGNICIFSMNEMGLMINTQPSDSKAELDITDIELDEGIALLQGIAYWLVVGDHCYIVQHQRLNTKALEEYFTWLFQQTSCIANSQKVILQSEFDISNFGNDIGEVKTIEIGGYMSEPARAKLDTSEQFHVVGNKWHPLNKAKGIIESLFGKMETQKLVDTLPSEAHLGVQVRIGYITNKQNIDRAALKTIATSLRNIEDGDIKIHGSDGIINGDSARLSQSMNINLVRENSTLLDFKDAESKMWECHCNLLKSGKIEDK